MALNRDHNSTRKPSGRKKRAKFGAGEVKTESEIFGPTLSRFGPKSKVSDLFLVLVLQSHYITSNDMLTMQ